MTFCHTLEWMQQKLLPKLRFILPTHFYDIYFENSRILEKCIQLLNLYKAGHGVDELSELQNYCVGRVKNSKQEKAVPSFTRAKMPLDLKIAFPFVFIGLVGKISLHCI